MAGAFYRVDGDRLVPSELTRGPWDPAAQHAGPPSALLARALERCEPRDGLRIARITVEILGPVPLAPLTATARVVRPGRSVELLEASLAGP
ncbi:MAG TPA: acyl-CoA thioesterase domain-containing protein, partial [Thermoleophilaceae bacterium]|nr:acyl-CoA thioesterase domain-containing protein [Thermoleophilaceae bacterium]